MKPQLTFVGQEFVTKNTGLIGYTIKRRFRTHIESRWEDMWDAGMDGLINAAIRFDSFYGTQFSTYAVWAIQRSIMTYLRKAEAEAKRRNVSLSDVMEEVIGRDCEREKGTQTRIAASEAIKTLRRQNNQKHVSIFLDYYQKGHTLQSVGDIHGISKERVRQIIQRMKENFFRDDEERKPIRRHYVTYKGRCLPLVEWAKELGMAQNTLRNRLKINPDPEYVLAPRQDNKAKGRRGRKKVQA